MAHRVERWLMPPPPPSHKAMSTRSLRSSQQSRSAYRDTRSSSSDSESSSDSNASEDSFEAQASVLPTPPRATSAHTPPSSSSSRQGGIAGLPQNIRIQLVTAIHSYGGIDRVQAAKLFEDYPECFGVPGTPRYTQVKNKITRWKTTQRHEYLELLEQHKQNFSTPDPEQASTTKASSGRRKASHRRNTSSTSSQQQQPPASPLSPSSPPVLLRAFSPRTSRIMGDNTDLDSLEAHPYGGTF